MSYCLIIDEPHQGWLLDVLIIAGALPGHASKPNNTTKRYKQIMGNSGAIKYFSLIEWNMQSKRQETKNERC